MDVPYDILTGEIFELERLVSVDKQRVVAEDKGYIPELDISKLTSRVGLMKRRYRVYKDGKCPRLGILDTTYAMECLSYPQLKLMSLLCDRVDFHNFAIVKPAELKSKMGWEKSMYNKKMKELGKLGCLVVHDIRVDKKGEKLVELHPFFEWVGSHISRSERLKRKLV